MRKSVVVVALTATLVGAGAFLIPAYKVYYTETEIEVVRHKAEAEALRIQIVGAALKENPEFIEYQKALTN